MLGRTKFEKSLDERKVSLIKRLFIAPADQDYVTARWAFSHVLAGQFFWSGSQTLEKYMKALLLLNNETIRGAGHDLNALYVRVCELDEHIIPRFVSLPKTTGIGHDAWNGQPMDEYIRHMATFGSSESRYGIAGTNMSSPLLHVLDHMAYALRVVMRFSNFLNSDLYLLSGRGERPGAHIEHPKEWVISDDLFLESLYYENYGVGQGRDLRRTFSNMNLSFFDKDHDHTGLFGGYVYMGSPIYNMLIRMKNPEAFNYPRDIERDKQNAKIINQLKQWVYTHIPLSSSVKAVLDDPVYKDGVPPDDE